MNVNQNKNLFQHQTIPTMLSIDAQSQVSVDLKPNQMQPLISRILLLCIQLQRKDRILEQLQKQTQLKDQMRKSQIQITNRDMLARYDRLEYQNRILAQSNAVLKNNVVNMERIIADLQIHKQRSAYNRELEDKAYNLQLKLKRAEQQKIQYLERQKNLKRQNSMLSYSAIKTTQKNRIKDLQNELSQQKLRLDTQRRLTAQLKYELEKKSMEINSIKQTQISIRRSYEQRIQRIQFDKNAQNLRQSQCKAANDEKIVLLSQQLNRLRQQLQILRNQLKSQRQKVEETRKQNSRLVQSIKSLQNEIKISLANTQKVQEQKMRKIQQYNHQIQSYEQNIKALKISHADMQYYLEQRNAEYGSKDNQIGSLLNTIQNYQKQIDNLKSQIRKLKRKGQMLTSDCQICKIRSSNTISSSKSIDKIKPMNLQQIIKQTQKLNISNKKIQNLINHHQIIAQHHSQHNISTLQHSQQTLVNINQ